MLADYNRIGNLQEPRISRLPAGLSGALPSSDEESRWQGDWLGSSLDDLRDCPPDVRRGR